MNSSNFYAFSAFFNGLFGLFLVYYVYLRNRRNVINRSFLYFGIAVSGWSLIYAFWMYASSANQALFFIRRHMIFVSFIPSTFFYFVSALTGRAEKYRSLIYVFFAISVCSAFAMFTPYLIVGTKKTAWFDYWPAPGSLLPSFLVYYAILALWGLGMLGQKIFKTYGVERKQAIWIFVAFIIGFGGGSFNWFLWFDIPIPPVTNFFVGVTFAMIAFAIVRYGLMDVDMFVDFVRSSRTTMLGIMASSLSHELRNPLFIARGALETHKDSIDRNAYQNSELELQKSRETHELVLTQLNRSADIIQRFLGLSRTRNTSRIKSKINLLQAISGVLDLLKMELELRSVSLSVQVNPDFLITAYPEEIEEVLLNLIMNSVQAMKDSEKYLTVRTFRDSKHLRLEIQDTGAGISEEDQKRIFEPFFTTRGDKGTGLGLYIAKQLVERNGGRITVKSKIRQGATFILEFKR